MSARFSGRSAAGLVGPVSTPWRSARRRGVRPGLLGRDAIAAACRPWQPAPATGRDLALSDTAVLRLAAVLHLHLAVEVGSLLHNEGRGVDLAGHVARGLDLDAAGGEHLAVHRTRNGN